MNNYADKTLSCVECGGEFVFTAGEQEFHQQKGFTNEPVAAQAAARRGVRSAMADPTVRTRVAAVEAVTAALRASSSPLPALPWQQARIPFQPRGDRPVYCSDCFRTQQAGGVALPTVGATTAGNETAHLPDPTTT